MSVDPFTQPRWYAMQTRSWCDKRVRDQLTAKALLPFLPLFRGSLFGSFTFQQKCEVLATVGVTRLVRFNGEPVPIPEEQIEAVRTLVTRQLRYDPHPYLVEGMQVHITHGPLAGGRRPPGHQKVRRVLDHQDRVDPTRGGGRYRQERGGVPRVVERMGARDLRDPRLERLTRRQPPLCLAPERLLLCAQLG